VAQTNLGPDAGGGWPAPTGSLGAGGPHVRARVGFSPLGTTVSGPLYRNPLVDRYQARFVVSVVPEAAPEPLLQPAHQPPRNGGCM
jgi:hypothetical protein